MTGQLLFHLLTPQKEVASLRCDSVNLYGKDSAEGWGGGSIGILHGHLPAVIALAEGGPIRVTAEGKTLLYARVRGGFARVEPESVTVLSPEAEIIEENWGG